jgi:formate C-acetyltransferase
MQPAKDFLSGLLAARFAWLLDGCDSLGRLDQALGPLLERDLDSGALDLSLARRLLDELFRDFERFNGWNLQIGGRRWEDGRDGCNRLTLELLEASARLKFRKPSIAFRVTSDTPRPALARALAVLGRGSGRPALYNDDLYVRSLLALDLGLTERDAREIGFGGCTETMIAGLSNVGSLDGGLNLALALSLALNDGRDPLNGEQAGPATGAFTDFADFTAFKAAVEGQIRHQVENLTGRLTKALRQRFTQGDPKLFRTMLTRDCVRRGLSFEAGGARYNWSVISLSGVADLIDGLAAVRHCVFETRTVSREALLAALAADFAGFEEVRRHLLAAPRFGNDLPEVDELGAGILDFTCRALLSHLTPRGGRFVPSVINFTTYAEAGRKVGALPDGRRAGEPLADSIGPKAGRDVHGPTAMLRSVARLPGCLMAGTPVLNLRLHPRLLNHQEGRERCVDLVRTFFDLGGLQIQITAADREVLRAAQRDPESHRDLIVRIGGYSEYFTQLSPALQETVIERTEHGSA